MWNIWIMHPREFHQEGTIFRGLILSVKEHVCFEGRLIVCISTVASRGNCLSNTWLHWWEVMMCFSEEQDRPSQSSGTPWVITSTVNIDSSTLSVSWLQCFWFFLFYSVDTSCVTSNIDSGTMDVPWLQCYENYNNQSKQSKQAIKHQRLHATRHSHIRTIHQ